MSAPFPYQDKYNALIIENPPHLDEREASVQQIYERADSERWGGDVPWIGALMVKKAIHDIDKNLGIATPHEQQLLEEMQPHIALDTLVRHMDATSRYASTIPTRPPYIGNPERQAQLNGEFTQRRQERIDQTKAEVSRTASLVASLSGEDETSLIREQLDRVDAYDKSYQSGVNHDRAVQSTRAPRPDVEVATGKIGGAPLGRYETEQARLGKARTEKTKRRGLITRLRHRRYRRDITKNKND